MDFSFPANITTENGMLKYFTSTVNGFNTSPIDINQPLKNVITIDNTDYFFNYIEPGGRNKGGNSIILKLYDSQNIDLEDINYDEPDLILKILKFKTTPYKKKIQLRFEREIEALNRCKNKQFQNIITIFHNGTCKIYNASSKRYENFLYYTMEYAKYDLKQYIEQLHQDLTLENKIAFSKSIAEGIKELRTEGYYHRDLKPDNIFMIGNDWKIGDLGLVAERSSNFELDYVAEAIGPRGWMSPEAMNKFLTENKDFSYKYDCLIDHQSDIFQLGKVFWYIFQYNAPIGCIKEKDFKVTDRYVYPILRTMLNHSKKKRYKKIEEVISLFNKIDQTLLSI